jgi:hypothetical protein
MKYLPESLYRSAALFGVVCLLSSCDQMSGSSSLPLNPAPTPTPTKSATPTPLPKESPTPTATPTPTSTATHSSSPTPTPTPTLGGAGSIPFTQGFESNTDGVIQTNCGGSQVGTLTRYAYGVNGPLGVIPAPVGSLGSSYAVTTYDNSQYTCAAQTWFGGTPDPSNTDFIAPPGPAFQGNFTQAISIYIPLTGADAWTPPSDSSLSTFQINADANIVVGNGQPDYVLEVNEQLTVLNGKVQVGASGDYYFNPASWNTFATITQTDWYTFTETFIRPGNGTTDPPIMVLGVYNSAGSLIGQTTVSCVGGAPGETCNAEGSDLRGTDQIDLSQFQPGWSPNGIAIDNVVSYLGVPNPTTAPTISNSGTYTGTHGQAFSLQIDASNSPTSYLAVQSATAVNTLNPSPQLPAGLSLNPTTGLISGTPTAAGSYTFMLTAINGNGVGAETVHVVIN